MVVKTGFSLLCNIEEINKTDEIQDPLTKKAIKATGDIMEAMRKGDSNKLAELSYSQKEIDFFKGILPFYQNIYKSDGVEFLAQIKLENKRLIVYKTFMENNNQKIPANLYSLLCEKDDKFVFVFPNATETMIAEIASRSIDNGLNENMPAQREGEKLHKLRIYHDSSSGNDCYLLFTGIPVQKVDVSTYDEQNRHAMDTVHQIITLFKSALNDIKVKSIEDYANLYYTKESGKTFVTSLSRKQKEALEGYLNIISNGGFVIYYIIDASPYYVVFYTQKENKLDPSEKKTKKYNYVFCIEENEKLKFTNLLKSNTFFDALLMKKMIDMDQVIDQDNAANQ